MGVFCPKTAAGWEGLNEQRVGEGLLGPPKVIKGGWGGLQPRPALKMGQKRAILGLSGQERVKKALWGYIASKRSFWGLFSPNVSVFGAALRGVLKFGAKKAKIGQKKQSSVWGLGHRVEMGPCCTKQGT